ACATAWCGTPHPARARTGTRAPRPGPRPAGRGRTLRPARSFSGLQIVRGRHRHRARLRVRLERRLDVAVGDRARPGDPELLEQKGERLLEVGRDRGTHVRRQVPHAALEGPDRLLAALVVKL